MCSTPIISGPGPHPVVKYFTRRLRLDEVISKRNGLQVVGAPGEDVVLVKWGFPWVS